MGIMRNTSARRKNEYALITGASSGIGYELAKVFARNGFNTILVARSLQRLEAVAQELARDYMADCHVISADLSLMSGVEEVHRKVHEKKLNVSVLVNDAGVGMYGPFCQADFGEEAQMINLNVLGLTYLTRFFAEEMVENRSGRILNVASCVGFWSVPNMSVYAATKAYVISFSQSLAIELKGTGVQVSVLCPGVVDTGFMSLGSTKETSRPCGAVGGILGRMKRMRYMKAAAVASIAYRDLMKGRRVIVPSSFMGRIIMVTKKVVPQGLMADLTARSRGRASSDRQ
jgi:short-subunit dehydrogenase